jgi:hypothetical protein
MSIGSLDLDPFFTWLQSTPVSRTIAENEVLFPWIESVHVLAFVIVLGTISVVDLRLLGFASMDRAASRLMHDVLPVTWIAFAIAAVTGSLMFSSNAMTYAHNGFFRTKFIFLALAGLNMALFHLLGIRDIKAWDAAQRTPPAARAAGAVSIAVWISVVVCGRWTGFTLR